MDAFIEVNTGNGTTALINARNITYISKQGQDSIVVNFTCSSSLRRSGYLSG